MLVVDCTVFFSSNIDWKTLFFTFYRRWFYVSGSMYNQFSMWCWKFGIFIQFFFYFSICLLFYVVMKYMPGQNKKKTWTYKAHTHTRNLTVFNSNGSKSLQCWMFHHSQADRMKFDDLCHLFWATWCDLLNKKKHRKQKSRQWRY